MKSRKAVFSVEINEKEHTQLTRELRLRLKGSIHLYPELSTEMLWHWDYLCPRAPLKTTLKCPNMKGRIYEIYS